MNKLKLISVSALAVLLTVGQWSCSQEPTTTQTDGSVRVSCSIAGNDTRVQYLDSGNGSGYFEQGDIISLTIQEENVTDAEVWKTNNQDATELLIDNNGVNLTWGTIAPYGNSATFIAHYPRWSSMSYLEDEYPRAFYPGRDPLYAKATVTYGGGVLLTFEHCASQLVVNLKWNDGTTDQTFTDPATVTVGSIRTNGYQRWSDGKIVEGASINAYHVDYEGAVTVGANITTGTCSTTLAPQSLDGKTLTVVYQKLNGQTQIITATLPATAELEAGKTLTINATLKGDLLEIGSVTVGEWGETVEMSADANINISNKINWDDATITIATSMDLSELARRVNGTQPDGMGGYLPAKTFEGQSFTLLNNIAILENQWPMIGLGYYDKPKDNKYFQGTFDGSGYEITNLQIDSNSDCLGLFGCLGSKGKVMNIVMSGAVVATGEGHSGGIVGMNYGIVEGCIFNSTVSGSSDASSCLGGVVGHNFGIVRICCSTEGSHVTAANSGAALGGIVGYNDYSDSDTNNPNDDVIGRVYGCYSAATVSQVGRNGGIVGSMDYKNGHTSSYYDTSIWSWVDYTDTGDIKSCYFYQRNNNEREVGASNNGWDQDAYNAASDSPCKNAAAINAKVDAMNNSAEITGVAACQFRFVAGTGGAYPTIVKK